MGNPSTLRPFDMLTVNKLSAGKLRASIDGVVGERFVAVIVDRGSQKAEVNRKARSSESRGQRPRLQVGDKEYFMANSTIATKDVENWIRSEFLQKKYNQAFAKRKLGVQSGAQIEFDAVSEDGNIVCIISTSPGKTTDGKPDTDVLAKIREKALWAISLNEKPEIIVFVYTYKSMGELLKEEKGNGRFPKHIKTLLVKLPAEFEAKLA